MGLVLVRMQIDSDASPACEVLQIKRCGDEDDGDGGDDIIIIIARCGRRRQGSCHAVRHRIHCCLAVYQQSITLSVAVMAILRALVALGRRKANGSSSKEIHLPAAD